MNREQLEEHVNQAVLEEKECVFFWMNGDPNNARQYLLGHRWGPKGWVIGHKSPNNLVRFNAEYVQDYLDDLSTSRLSHDADCAMEIATAEDVELYSLWNERQGKK